MQMIHYENKPTSAYEDMWIYYTTNTFTYLQMHLLVLFSLHHFDIHSAAPTHFSSSALALPKSKPFRILLKDFVSHGKLFSIPQ